VVAISLSLFCHLSLSLFLIDFFASNTQGVSQKLPKNAQFFPFSYFFANFYTKTARFYPIFTPFSPLFLLPPTVLIDIINVPVAV